MVESVFHFCPDDHKVSKKGKKQESFDFLYLFNTNLLPIERRYYLNKGSK